MNAPIPSSEFVLRMCFGKQAFDTRGAADRAARRINKSLTRRRPVNAYLCACCGSHHIGGGKPQRG